MNNLWYKIVRFYVKLGLLSYFKKINVYGVKNIPKDQPVLFVANHRNGLIDPIIVAITSQRIHHFLTRASAFKNPIANFLLRSIKMLPIYRIRDGVDSIKRNQEIFEACYTAFNKKGTVLIFPEGNHGLQRRLRPLSKGFTRIAYGYIDKYHKKDLLIIPIGLNYDNFREKGSSVSVYYGKPISVSDFYNPQNENEAIESLKSKISDSLKELSTHIDDIKNHTTIERALINNGIDFLDPFTANDTIANTTEWVSPKKIIKPKKSFFNYFLTFLFSLNTITPIVTWHLLKPTIKDPVLVPTFRIALSAFLIPLFYLLQSFLVILFFSSIWGLVYLTGSVLLLYIYKNSIQMESLTTNPS